MSARTRRAREAQEVFEKLLEMTLTYTPGPKPGAMLNHLSKRERAALKKLTSDDVARHRAVV